MAQILLRYRVAVFAKEPAGNVKGVGAVVHVVLPGKVNPTLAEFKTKPFVSAVNTATFNPSAENAVT